VRIGPNAVVAAGALVTKDVPPDTVVAGSPAKVLCSLEDYKQKVIRVWVEQRPPGYLADFKDGVRYSPTEIQAGKLRDFHKLRAHLIKTLWKT